MPNKFPIIFKWTIPFPNLRLLSGIFYLNSQFDSVLVAKTGRYHCTIRHRECGCNKDLCALETSTGVLWSTLIFALLIPGHDLFYILEALF